MRFLATVASMLLSIVQMAVILPIYFSAAELPQLADKMACWGIEWPPTLSMAFIALFVVRLSNRASGLGGFRRKFAKRLTTGAPT